VLLQVRWVVDQNGQFFVHCALSFLNTGSVPLLHSLVLLQVRWVVDQNGQPQTSLLPGQTSSDGEHSF
jgi:hypothetical protein